MKGPIPSEISRLSQLYTLDLSSNSFSGVIPSPLFPMPSLNKLHLDRNQFTAPLKFQNTSSSALWVLSVSGNVMGTMELKLFLELKNLSYLDLSGTNLLVPKGNMNATLPQFIQLDLSSCNLHEFPDFLKTQDVLFNLDLSNNKIEGKITKWFWNVRKESLYILDLSHNLLSGFDRPPMVLSWNILNYLDLHSNMLQGSFPIPPLSTIYFFASNNKMSGRIPPNNL